MRRKVPVARYVPVAPPVANEYIQNREGRLNGDAFGQSKSDSAQKEQTCTQYDHLQGMYHQLATMKEDDYHGKSQSYRVELEFPSSKADGRALMHL